jgi:hypothetical protein
MTWIKWHVDADQGGKEPGLLLSSVGMSREWLARSGARAQRDRVAAGGGALVGAGFTSVALGGGNMLQRRCDGSARLACQFNGIDPGDLFRRYEEAGFLYPAKKQRLAPVLSEVLDNWRKAYEAGLALKLVASCEDPESGAWATVGGWRTTHDSWHSQHLVSSGGGATARVALLGLTARMQEEAPNDVAYQSWFQPTNRFAQGLFGSVQDALGADAAVVKRFAFFGLPLTAANGAVPSGLRFARVTPADQQGAVDFVERLYGSVYARAEELAHEDFELDALDQRYSASGLRRYRRLYAARRVGADDLLGLALVYRGPLGFNFSFLENRCQIIVPPSLDEVTLEGIVRGLITMAAPDYAGLRVPALPVVIPHSAAPVLSAQRGTLLREYAQSAWLHNALPAWGRHIERFYERIMRLRQDRPTDGSAEAAGGVR